MRQGGHTLTADEVPLTVTSTLTGTQPSSYGEANVTLGVLPSAPDESVNVTPFCSVMTLEQHQHCHNALRILQSHNTQLIRAAEYP